MSAVFRHELRGSFHSLTSYLFGACLLAFIGLWAMLYNIEASVSNFEYVLQSGIFDWSAVVFYLSVTAFFLFLCVQSLEKRRYKG